MSNIKSRTNAKNNFKKSLRKLMNNALYNKTVENMIKHRKINPVIDHRKKNNLVSELNY